SCAGRHIPQPLGVRGFRPDPNPYPPAPISRATLSPESRCMLHERRGVAPGEEFAGMDEQNEQAVHGAESSGRSESAYTRAGEGGEERASYRHPDTHREQVSRPGEPDHPGAPNWEAAPMFEAEDSGTGRAVPVSDAPGERVGSPDDVLNLDDD